MMKKKYMIGFVLILLIAGIAGAVTMYIFCGDRIENSYICLSGYKHLSIKAEKKRTVSRQEIEDTVASRLAADQVYRIDKNSTIKQGDLVNISFQGYLNEESDRADMDQEHYDLEIGSGTFIDGFEDGLIGKKPGTQVEMKLRFPDDYRNKLYAGQDVLFRVKLNYVKKKYSKENLSDAFIRKHTSYQSVDELYRSTEQELKELADEEYRQACVEQIWKQLFKKAEVKKYNEEYLEEEGRKFDETYDEHAKELGVTSYEFISDYCGYSLKEYSKKRETESRQLVKKRMIVEAIAKKEHLEADSYEKLQKKTEQMLLDGTTYGQE